MTEQWQELKETITEMRDNDGTGTQQEVCKFLANYMEVLEKQMQEPCEDCISRQAVIELVADYDLSMGQVVRGIHALPSVKSKYTDEEIDKAQAVEQAYVDKMVELAVEETKRPKGKWIEIEIDAGEFIYKCTKCGMRVINPYKYCPMCGSYNGGGKDGDSN